MSSELSLPSTYKSVHLASRPTGPITPSTFRTQTQQSPSPAALRDGQVLYRAHYLSLDPAMRGWLNDVRSYLPPVAIGAVMRGYGVGIVLASRSARAQPGDVVLGHSGWRELAVLSERDIEPLGAVAPGASPTDFLGVLGTPGLTAYFGALDVGRIKRGDLVVVSGAAGATGSVVGQIAKIQGATVLGIAGGADKCKWLTDELGFDAALDYKSATFAKDFRDMTKSNRLGLIDVFFDNTGGEVLDLALSRAKEHARFVICGAISQYNAGNKEATGPRNYLMIITMRIRMQGFIVMDYAHRYDEARRDLSRWMAEGKLKRQETILKGGIETMPQALSKLFEGRNTGKLLVDIRSSNPDLPSKL